MTTIYLVRHGETEWNATRRFQGQSDTDLNDTGVKQAKAVAEWITAQGRTFSAIYSSDLKRTRDTAKPIAEALGLTTVESNLLREINCGLWEGLFLDDIDRDYPDEIRLWREAIDQFRMPEGEGILDVQKRAVEFYEKTIPNHPGESIVIVSHGAALLSLICGVTDRDLVATWGKRDSRLLNTSVTILAYDETTKHSEIVGYNLTEHLATFE